VGQQQELQVQTFTTNIMIAPTVKRRLKRKQPFVLIVKEMLPLLQIQADKMPYLIIALFCERVNS
jgi:hypothetical protein